jgi:RNA recognition motif-containing protein
MGKKLYVGNLTYGVTDGTLATMFDAHGTVKSAQVITDRDTGRSKGFGFVEMGSDQEAQAAVQNQAGRRAQAEETIPGDKLFFEGRLPWERRKAGHGL